ncbi:MAG: hypothetical protein IT364_12865 [Candidatus Hydrogenedentes bacterium]|nr:hypothetical protein [Candidatus Hydrogenedentota bacterium]
MGTRGRHRYEFHDWNLFRAEETALVYRPSMRTLLRRFGYSLFAGALLVLVQYLGRQAPDILDLGYARNDPEFQAHRQELSRQAEELRQAARDGMTEEQRIAYDAELEQWQAAAEAQYEDAYGSFWTSPGRIALAVRMGMIVLSVLLAAAAILPPLMSLIEQITVASDGRGNLAVTRRRCLVHTHTCPLSDLGAMTITAAEKVVHAKHGTRRLGYRWAVSIESPSSGTRFEFHPDHQKLTPVEGQRLPERVEMFAQGLARMTGLQIPAPFIVDYQSLRPTLFGRRGEMVVRNQPVVTHTSRAYAMDEIPPELRGHVDALLAQAKVQPGVPVTKTFTRGSFTYRDPNGQEHTYTSVDEMPPDVRALFEKIRRETEGK